MSLNELPIEILSKITSYTNAGDIENVSIAIPGISVSELVYDRNNPHTYLQLLTPETDKLLLYMRETTTVLYGSRAIGMFYPCAVVKDSDYNFYCTNTVSHILLFMQRLESLGAIYNSSVENLTATKCYRVHGYLNNNRITITSSINTPIWDILEHHSTITQCFITGYCAVSLYHTVSTRGMIFGWKVPVHNDYYEFLEEENEYKIQKYSLYKYTKRGFCVIKGLFPDSSGIINWPGTNTQVKHRQGGDDNAKIIDFTPYLRDISDMEKNTIHVSIDTIKRIEWTEVSYGNEIGTYINTMKHTISLHKFSALQYKLLQGFKWPLVRIVVVDIPRSCSDTEKARAMRDDKIIQCHSMIYLMERYGKLEKDFTIYIRIKENTSCITKECPWLADILIGRLRSRSPVTIVPVVPSFPC